MDVCVREVKAWSVNRSGEEAKRSCQGGGGRGSAGGSKSVCAGRYRKVGNWGRRVSDNYEQEKLIPCPAPWEKIRTQNK